LRENSHFPVIHHCEHLTGFSGSTQKKMNLNNRLRGGFKADVAIYALAISYRSHYEN